MVWFVNISRKVCQLTPHLANHWDWLSLKRMGSNFMAQSWIATIVWSSNWCEAESPYAGEHSLPWCHYKVVIPSQNRMYLLSRFNYFYVNSRRNVESENIRVPDGIWTHNPPWSSRMLCHWATGDSVVSKGQIVGIDLNRIAQLYSNVVAHMNSLTASRCHMKASHMNSLTASRRHLKAYRDASNQPPKWVY